MPTTTNFIKYHSLGNDFILFDWWDEPRSDVNKIIENPEWSHFVQKLCQRHFGIGANGILIVCKDENNGNELFLFNDDGTNGQKCLNGIRCAAYHLFSERHCANSFDIKMSNQLITCKITQDNNNINVSAYIPNVVCENDLQLVVDDLRLRGVSVNVGNPHFVISKSVSLEWLEQYGQLIESHHLFPHKTNVEFVWFDEAKSQLKELPVYNVLVYERACGITQACGTGAAAVVRMLYNTKQIRQNQKIFIKMLGGYLESFVNDKNEIVQIAPAFRVFTGSHDLSV